MISVRHLVLMSLLLLVVVQGAVLAYWYIRDRRHRLGDRQARLLRSEHTHAGRLALVGEIAGSIAHELRHPLAQVRHSLGAMQRVLPAPGRLYLWAMLRNSLACFFSRLISFMALCSAILLSSVSAMSRSETFAGLPTRRTFSPSSESFSLSRSTAVLLGATTSTC